MAKSESELILDRSVRIIGSYMVASSQSPLAIAMMVDGEFYKMQIKIEKVVEGEE